MAPKTLLVTVGTTKFDNLVKRVTDTAILKECKSKGFGTVVIQYGKSDYEPPQGMSPEGINIEAFSLKDSLKDDIEKSDLVISHAGAGSCLEVLRAKKPLVVVVNEDLMDNHQIELSEALSNQGCAFACTVTSLLETLRMYDPQKLNPYPLPDSNAFPQFVDKVMGFKKEL